MDNYPLVSIPVITYNSSAYIIEGLESVKSQTYKNIELVISDDCSTDNTVEICQKWIDENKEYFKRAIVVTTDHNTGVAGNLNRAIKECQGLWIKVLSGDDKLFPYSIKEYISFISSNANINICFGKMQIFGHPEVVKKIQGRYYLLFDEIKNPDNQYIRYLKHHYIPGPGLFFKKSLWEEIDGFDERYQFCEEFPFNLAVLRQGDIVYYIDRYLYRYNAREDSISNGEHLNYRNFKDEWQFFKDIKFKEMIKNKMILRAYDELTAYNLAYNKNFKDQSKISKILAYLFRTTSPFFWYSKIKHLFQQSL